jgi:IS4 transposase
MLSAEHLQALYEQAPRCWTRKLTIDALFWLVVQVAAGARNSVFAAFQADQAEESPSINVSHQAVYGKLNCMPVAFGTLLVRASGERAMALLEQGEQRTFAGLEAYRLRVIDGTDLAGTEHRLQVLRKMYAAGLPGRFVVAYDWATGVCYDATASEDAYTSERVLVQQLLAQATKTDLYLMDRHYCTTAVLQAILAHEASFVVREHVGFLRCCELSKPRKLGRIDTGVVYEQMLKVEDTSTGKTFECRRLILKLDQPTEQGESEIQLLTNLPKKVAGRSIVALYRERWTLERHFDFLKNCLHGEIESLGQPQAAIFMMCMALVAGNAFAVVQSSLRAVHGVEESEKLSGYYLADELAGNYRSVEKLLADEWDAIERMTAVKFWNWMTQVAKEIRTRAFYKHPRGPKRPTPPRRSGKTRHHYSTYRLLQSVQKKP